MTSSFIDITKCFAENDTTEFAEKTIADGFYKLLDLVPGSVESTGFINAMSGNTDQVKTVLDSKCSLCKNFYVYFDKASKGYKIRSLYTGKYLGVRKVDDVDSHRITQNELNEKNFYQDWMIQEECGEYVLRLKTKPGQFKYLSVLKREFIYPTSKENVARTFKLYKAD